MQEDLLIESLGDNIAALPLKAFERVQEYAGNRVVRTCRNLSVQQFSRMGLCEIEVSRAARPDMYRYWGGEDFDRLYTSYNQVVWQVQWQGQELIVIHLEWEIGCGGDRRDYVVAERRRSQNVLSWKSVAKRTRPEMRSLSFQMEDGIEARHCTRPRNRRPLMTWCLLTI